MSDDRLLAGVAALAVVFGVVATAVIFDVEKHFASRDHAGASWCLIENGSHAAQSQDSL